ncbi:helix-turn-helix domain-containing protein [Variovorax paradoxus]|uniref:helix-turn-helix domain-containing protein n=1 Tax=Variovorax paradoxus TaxID=34073 RepID=UPI003D657E0A
MSIVDVCGRMGNVDWTGRTLPANVAVLSVTTTGEIASDKDDRAAPALALTGAATRAGGYAVARDVTVTLALLHPRWISTVAGTRSSACTDRRLSVTDLVPAQHCRRLLSAMREASNPQGRSRVLLHWLREVWRDAAGRPKQPADSALAGPESPRSTSARSQRQRERIFLRDHGVSMSRYRSIERFQQAVAGLAGGQSGAAVALEAGYADQSHMCHQVRTFSGLTPTQLKQALSAGLFTATYAAMPGFEKQLVL